MSVTNYDPAEHEPMPEGEEAPPPLTHTMAIVRWAILIGMSLFALGMILTSLGLSPWEARADDNIQYHCPMHPTYISNQPGDCPICGMSLVPIDKSGKEIKDSAKTSKAKEKAGKTVSAKYACPMHPEVTSDKPGRCPKCGMNLVAVKSPAPTTTKTAIEAGAKKAMAAYVCPMHPEVTSEKSGSCSKCGMNLVEVKSPEGSTAAATDSSKGHEAAKYTCPMHPEVISDKPGRCPKCGMFLEPVGQDSTKSMPNMPDKSDSMENMDSHKMPGMGSIEQKNSEMSDMGEAPVPGLVPITIEPERLQLIGIRTAKVSRQNLGGKINITGFVTPDETRLKNISTRVNGWALNLFVDKTGQFVEAGKPLMALYSQDLYQAEQDFMVARDALKGDSSDAALNGMRRQIYDAARERLHLLGLSDGQVGEIEKSDAPSPQMMITSPFSGYVLEKSVLPGQYISPDQILFTLADLSKVWVLGDIYEQDISYVHQGQKASVSLITYPGEVFEGAVSYIYPSVSEKTRTLKVRIELSNSAMRLRPGMYAQVSLERDGGEMLAVPTEAVIDAGKTRYAFVVHDGKHFEPRLLKVGRSSDDFTEVLSGLKEGEEVVTSANFLIDSESRLKAAVSGIAGMPGMPDMAEDQNRGSAGGAKR